MQVVNDLLRLQNVCDLIGLTRSGVEECWYYFNSICDEERQAVSRTINSDLIRSFLESLNGHKANSNERTFSALVLAIIHYRLTKALERRPVENWAERYALKAFLDGKCSPLELPTSYRVEFDSAGKSYCLYNDSHAEGYSFFWGHLIEHRHGNILKWDIRFDNLHGEYLAGGGNSIELKGICDMWLQSELVVHIPPSLSLMVTDSTLATASASLTLFGDRQEKAARVFMARNFLYGKDPIMKRVYRQMYQECLNYIPAVLKPLVNGMRDLQIAFNREPV